MKLTTRATALSLLLAVAPLGVVSFLAYESERSSLESDTRRALTAVARLKAAELDRWVEANAGHLHSLAQRPLVRDYAAGHAALLDAEPDHAAAHLGLVEDHLAPALQPAGGFAELFILSVPDGRVDVSTRDSSIGGFCDDEPYFTEGARATYVQGVYRCPASGELRMTVATPIKGPGGETVAVLAGHLDVGELGRIAATQSGLGASEDSYLVNGSGLFVTEPLYRSGVQLAQRVETRGVAECLSGSSGTAAYLDYRGVAVIGAYRWLAEQDVCIVTEIDRTEVLAPVADLRSRVMLAGGLSALAAALMAVLFVGTITRPLRRLAAAAHEIGRGNLGVRVATGGRDEIAELSRALDLMAADLGETMASRDELEREVAERRRAEAELQRRIQEEEVLVQTGRVISSDLDIGQVYERFAEELRGAIDFDRLAINTMAEECGKAAALWISAGAVKGRAPGERFPLEGSLTGEVLRMGRGVVLSGESREAILERFPGLAPTVEAGGRSILSVPLVSKGEVFGALQLTSYRPRAYGEPHLAFMTRVASQIAGAVANARLHAQLAREAEEREVLARIGRVVASSLDFGTIFEQFAGLVRRLIQWDRLVISVGDARGASVTNPYVAGMELPGWAAGVTHALAGSLTERVLQQKSYVIMTPQELALSFPPAAGFAAAGLRSMLSVPVLDREDVVAVLHFRSTRANAYSARDAELGERIGAQIAGAVVSSRLYAELEREAREREVLTEIGRIVGSSLDTGEVYQRFAEEVRRLIPFDRLTIATPDFEHGRSTNLYVAGTPVPGWEPGVPTSMPPSDAPGALGEWVGAGMPGALLLDSAAAREIAAYVPSERAAVDAGLVSSLVVPIIWQDVPIAAMVFRSAIVDAYTPEHGRLAERVAAQIAGTIENAMARRDLLLRSAAIESSTDAIVFADADGVVTFANAAAERMFKRSGAEMVGRDLTVLMPEEYRRRHRADIRSMGGDRPERVIGRVTEVEGLRGDGEAFPAEMSLSRVRGEGGDTFVALVRDVTERAEAQRALKDSEQRFRTIFEHATDGIWVVDANEWRHHAASESFCRMLGYTREEMVDIGVADVHPAESLPYVSAQFERQVRGETRLAPDIPMKRKDGSVFFADVTSSVVTIAGRQCLMSFFRDVTERHSAEEERERLLEERGRHIKHLTCLHGVLRLFQTHETIEDVIRGAVRLVPPGWQYPEIARARIRFDGDEYVSEPFEETPWVQAAEITVESQPRGTIDVFYVQEPPHAHGGPFLAEERTLLDDIARTLSEAAERRILAERARARQAEAMQAARLASVGELAAGVAHEINNPINGIINYAELLATRLGAEGENAQFLQGIVQEGERVASIVRNLLTFARDARQRHSPARVSDILEASLQLLRRRLEGNGIDLRVDVPDDLPKIRCRSQQIQQVFINLISNARDALNEKYPQSDPDKVLAISAGTVDLDGRQHVRVVFHDHGTGIPESALPRVFDPFFSTKPEDSGTGLGLAISYGIVKEHRGRIHLESAEGQFTKAVVDLPVDNGRESGS